LQFKHRYNKILNDVVKDFVYGTALLRSAASSSDSVVHLYIHLY